MWESDPNVYGSGAFSEQWPLVPFTMWVSVDCHSWSVSCHTEEIHGAQVTHGCGI